MLNINFPVPYGSITGVALTRLADHAELDLPLFDRSVGFPPFPPIPGPSCTTLTVGQSCSVMVGARSVPGPDAVREADTDAFAAGLISITPMDGDMTAGGSSNALHGIFRDLTP